MGKAKRRAEASAESDLKKNQARVSFWLDETARALKRESKFREFGKKVLEIYEAEKEEEQFNILYSNTETLAPALYNSAPRPDIQRRFKDDDPLAKVAGEVCKRSLEYLIDSDQRDYAPFDELMQSAVHEALVPGRGQLRFKYDADISEIPVEAEVDDEAAEGVEEEEAESEPSTYQKVTGEYVCGEDVAWDRFLHGYAKEWKDVPWVAFVHFMDKSELEENFGSALAARVNMAAVTDDGEEKSSPGKDAKGLKLATVYEIWDKRKRRVIFVSSGYPDGYLKEVEDPLGLSGFYPCPRPMQFFRRVSSMTPVALYAFYEKQAAELNTVTRRIQKIVAALKVRGFYDSTVEGLDKVMAADDNTLVPAENVAALQQGQTLEKAIFLMPIEKLVAVLQQLYTQRAQVKQVIYEITGIADIMRGSSQASETLGAQEIKNQWGTLRLKRAQKEVARFARDCLRIMAEIAVSKLSPETLKSMTGLPFPTAAEKQQAQAVAQQLQQQAIMQQPQPGQPTPEPQLPPEIQKALASPSWEEILQLLRDDLQRSYRVDIETNSTVDAEATEDKKDMGELMNAMAQFLNGVAPAVEQGILPFEAAKSMLLGLVRKFRFGADIEDQIKSMQPPQPKQEPQDAKNNPQVIQAQVQAETNKANLEVRKMQMEAQFVQQEHQLKMEELQLKRDMMMAKHRMDFEKMTAQAMLPAPQPQNPAGNKKPKPAGITQP